MDETLFGKYRLLVEIGHGGMADVFLAVAEGPEGSGFSKLTVIKRLRRNLAEDPEFVQMLVEEARIAARLNHPNVVQTNEVGQVDHAYFIAMEYLDGQPLQRIQVRANSRDGFPKELEYLIVCDALAGLQHAHELKDYDGSPLDIVHRDVTPHNLFVTYEGQVKVVDFGIARAAGRSSETRDGLLKGKVRYMGPEQAMGGKLDRRADLYATGILLWEIAAGRRMWKDMDETEILNALLNGAVPSSPKQAAPSANVPDAIDAICKKALATRIEDRYGTAEEMRADLEQYLVDSGQLLQARRKLGPFVAEVFARERDEMRSVLESQLRELTATSSSFRTVRVAVDSGGESSNRERSHGSAKSTRRGNSNTKSATSHSIFPQRRSSIGLLGAAVALLLGAGGVYAIMRHSAASPPSDVTPVPTVSAPPPAAPSVNAAAIPVPSATPSASVAAGSPDGAPSAASTTHRTHIWAAPPKVGPRPTATGDFSDFGGRK